jgi:hypothetical protein
MVGFPIGSVELLVLQEVRQFNILMEHEVHNRVQKSPPLVPIVSQITPVHTTPSYLSIINFNFILSSTSLSS